MSSEASNESSTKAAIGAGLLALDVVFEATSDAARHHAAGGSFGNVMTILAWLGWRAMPVARLGMDDAAGVVVADMQRHGVITDSIFQCARSSTPVIVHRYGLGSPDKPKHRFEWICPSCNRWLPRYVPLPKRNVPTWESFGRAEVCYIDRATPGTYLLARQAKENGAIVVFEPPKVSDDPTSRACLAICDVLKYSLEYGGRAETTKDIVAPVEIISLGASGLRYRVNGFMGLKADWTAQDAPMIRGSVDFAGCGDWLSAGFLHAITQGGRHSISDIDRALKFGQALAALNSLAAGARGLMTVCERDSVAKLAEVFSDGGAFEQPALGQSTGLVMECSQCVTCGGELSVNLLAGRKASPR